MKMHFYKYKRPNVLNITKHKYGLTMSTVKIFFFVSFSPVGLLWFSFLVPVCLGLMHCICGIFLDYIRLPQIASVCNKATRFRTLKEKLCCSYTHDAFQTADMFMGVVGM